MRRLTNAQPKLHVRKGDRVKVLSGDSRGAIGRILVMYPKKQTAIVELETPPPNKPDLEGINMVTKHIRPNQDHPEGARLKQEAPIRICKLQVVDPETGKGTRIGRRRNAAGKWERFAKRSGKTIPNAN